jgi:hypothetical protein
MISCPVCASDTSATYDDDTGVATCKALEHGDDFRWLPADTSAPVEAPPDAFVRPIGLNDALLKCIRTGEWVDTAVVTFRLAITHPEIYRELQNRFGHTADGPRRFSVSSYLGRRLGDLSRDPDAHVECRSTAGTGFYNYLSQIGMWTRSPVPTVCVDRPWAAYAHDVGFDPDTWPPLQYLHDKPM